MSVQIIPLDNSPNQSWEVSVNVDGQPTPLGVILRFNEIAQYWVMTITDQNGNLLLDSVPFVTGVAPDGSNLNAIQNLLNQFSYLDIGSAAVLNASGIAADRPNAFDLGTDFLLLWGDNPS